MKYVKMIIQKLTIVSGGAGTAYPSEAAEFTPGFQWGSRCSICCFLCNAW
jgi:hypothetical protein